MNEKKNIDRLFQEKFKDFESVPNDAVWDRISDSLPKKKKKRRVIALWWQIGGVAAAIALLLTVGVSLFDSDPVSNDDPAVVNTDKTDTEKENSNSEENQNDVNDLIDENSTQLAETPDNDNAVKEDKESNATIDEYHSNQLNENTESKNTRVANRPNSKESESNSSGLKKSVITTNKVNNTKVATTDKTSKINKKTNVIDDTKMKSVIKETINNEKSAVVQNDNSKNTKETNSTDTSEKTATNSDTENQDTIVNDSNKESITEAIAENNTEELIEKEDEQSRWSIAPNVAPVYFSSLGQGSSLDAQFNQNSKSSDINMSYGISGTYAVSKKLKIRAGVNRVNLSQTTSDVFAFTGGEFASRGEQVTTGNINTRDGIGNITLMSANVFDTNSTPEVFNTKIAGNIDQRFGFIEVPLEVEYRLIDKKIGLNVVGGFSTFFLNQNEIYADIEGTSTLIGEASNINSTSFSANFGLGIDYNLSKQWNINLEPQFKYQINTFNDTSGDFRPFFIGVYTGLSFKF